MEEFLTLQGEGKFTGQTAYFIRLAGCDVGCVWCDVKESWDANKYPRINAKILAENAKNAGAKIAVITGGEPAMYDLTDLCKALHAEGIRVHIETSAAYPIIGDFDWITISPKKFKMPLQSEMQKADELKIIVFNNSDFKWGEDWKQQVRADCECYLQVEWDKKETLSPVVIDYILHHPEWKLSVQTHKYLNIP